MTEEVAQCEMPRYECSKIVWALQIKDVLTQKESIYLTFIDDRFAAIQISPEYVQENKPESLGYYMVTEGEQASYLSEKSFNVHYKPEGHEWTLVDCEDGKLINLPETEELTLFCYGKDQYLGRFNNEEHEFGFYTEAIIGDGDFVEAEHVKKWKYLK